MFATTGYKCYQSFFTHYETKTKGHYKNCQIVKDTARILTPICQPPKYILFPQYHAILHGICFVQYNTAGRNTKKSFAIVHYSHLTWTTQVQETSSFVNCIKILSL